eukprot:jgi/Bigna1/81287/fgenesh1_pg.79_\
MVMTVGLVFKGLEKSTAPQTPPIIGKTHPLSVIASASAGGNKKGASRSDDVYYDCSAVPDCVFAVTHKNMSRGECLEASCTGRIPNSQSKYDPKCVSDITSRCQEGCKEDDTTCAYVCLKNAIDLTCGQLRGKATIIMVVVACAVLLTTGAVWCFRKSRCVRRFFLFDDAPITIALHDSTEDGERLK